MEPVTVSINDKALTVPGGITVASAVLVSGTSFFRRSVSDAPRGPLCGMGICFECRLKINGLAHRRSCQVIVEDGMKIETDEQN
jgi:sarcosine oxidase subunit alpha